MVSLAPSGGVSGVLCTNFSTCPGSFTLCIYTLCIYALCTVVYLLALVGALYAVCCMLLGYCNF